MKARRSYASHICDIKVSLILVEVARFGESGIPFCDIPRDDWPNKQPEKISHTDRMLARVVTEMREDLQINARPKTLFMKKQHIPNDLNQKGLTGRRRNSIDNACSK